MSWRTFTWGICADQFSLAGNGVIEFSIHSGDKGLGFFSYMNTVQKRPGMQFSYGAPLYAGPGFDSHQVKQVKQMDRRGT